VSSDRRVISMVQGWVFRQRPQGYRCSLDGYLRVTSDAVPSLCDRSRFGFEREFENGAHSAAAAVAPRLETQK